MTEIPEHILKRSKAARKQAELDDSVIPEHLLARSKAVRSGNRVSSTSAPLTIDDLFGEEAKKAKEDSEKLKRTVSIEKVSSAIVAATSFVSVFDSSRAHRAFLSTGDYQRFENYGRNEKKYLGVNIAESASVPVGEFSVRAEVNSNWRIPIDSKETDTLLGKGVKGKFRSALQFLRNDFLELSEEFFNDADFVGEFVSKETSAKQESATIQIFAGVPDDFDATYGDRYGLAVSRAHNIPNAQQIVSSGVLPSAGGVGNGFNTSSGYSQVSWPGSVYYAGSRQSRGLEYGYETTADVADCISDILNIAGQVSSPSVQGELTELIVQRVIPLVDSRS
jgi:hypothetical protein